MSKRDLQSSRHVVAEIARQILEDPEITAEELQTAFPGIVSASVTVSRLRRMLLDTLFVMDISPEHFSEYANRRYKCEKDVFCCKVLVRLGGREYAYNLALKALKEAERLELTGLEYDLLKLLRQVSYQSGRKTDHQRYNERLEKAAIRLADEQRAEFILESFLIDYTRSTHDEPASGAEMLRSVIEVEALFKKHNTFDLGNSYFHLASYAYQASLQFDKAIDVCHAALKFIKKRPLFTTPHRLLAYNISIMMSAVSSGNIHVAEAGQKECINLARVGSNNWFSVCDIRFLLMMQKREFRSALTFAKTVMKHERFPVQLEHLRMKWELYKAYAEFATGVPYTQPISRRIDPKERKTLFIPMPEYESDKAGLNFASIVLQLLNLFDSRQYLAAFERLDALRMYSTRYLKECPQAATFLKIFAIASEHHDDLKQLEKLIPPLITAMEKQQKETGYLEGLQVIPYPILGDLLFERLMRKPEEVRAAKKDPPKKDPTKKDVPKASKKKTAEVD
jgi:hypothetical protein